ncbi:hypothetical protein [Streptomyces hydrogenans]
MNAERLAAYRRAVDVWRKSDELRVRHASGEAIPYDEELEYRRNVLAVFEETVAGGYGTAEDVDQARSRLVELENPKENMQ